MSLRGQRSLNSFYPQLQHVQEKKLDVTFLWDRMMDIHGTQCKLFLIYVIMDLRVAILSFLCIKTLYILRTLKIQKNRKNYCKKKTVFAIDRLNPKQLHNWRVIETENWWLLRGWNENALLPQAYKNIVSAGILLEASRRIRINSSHLGLSLLVSNKNPLLTALAECFLKENWESTSNNFFKFIF